MFVAFLITESQLLLLQIFEWLACIIFLKMGKPLEVSSLSLEADPHFTHRHAQRL
jgi:hypothetical protein